MTFTHYLSALRNLYAPHGQEPQLRPGASDAELDDLQAQLPFTLNAALRVLWQQANGSERLSPPLFARPGYLSEYDLLSVDGALQQRRSMLKHGPHYDDYEDPRPRDARIRPGWFQEGWLPFGSWEGGTLLLIQDYSPAAGGQVGQIIAFTHDPDEISYVVASLPELLEESLAMLASDPEEFLFHGAPPERSS